MRIIDEDKLLLDIIDRGVDHIQTDDYAEICQIIAEQPTISAVPIEVLKEIRQELKESVDTIFYNGYPHDFIDGKKALEIIDTHIKEYTE